MLGKSAVGECVERECVGRVRGRECVGVRVCGCVLRQEGQRYGGMR